jgi:hypothetical protein
MKKIYDKVVEIKIEGIHSDFVDTCFYTDYHYTDEQVAIDKVEHFPTYEALFEAVSNRTIRGAKVRHTLFGNKPYCEFFDANSIDRFDVTAKRYKGVTVRVRWVEQKGYSLETLYKNLPAEEFLAFCADHNENFVNKIAKRG